LSRKKSIHDLAKELKVSAATISFVLNGKAAAMRISKEQQDRILKHIKETGYQPNLVAKSLRTGTTRIIGMLVEDISDPFFSAIARGIEESLYKKGYKIFYSSTENKTEKARELIKVLENQRVDAYIIAPAAGLETDIQLLVNSNVPLVLFDRYFPGIQTHNVVIDNYEGASNATTHLVQNGYRNIALATVASQQVQMVHRHNAYIDVLTGNGLQPHVLFVPYGLETFPAAQKVKAFIEKHREIDAILFATNYLTIAGLLVIKELGLRIPDDMAIIGFDDNTHFPLISPSVSAVAQPVKKIADTIVETITRLLISKEERKEFTTKVLPVELIIRESSVSRSQKE
jgi:LacI family transcriptional regulator